MDFFEQQEQARRNSRWLVLWYAAAVLLVVASYCAAAAFAYAFLAFWTGSFETYGAALAGVPAKLYLIVGGAVGGFILAVSAYRMWQLGDGGPVIAQLLGARYVEPGKCTPAERKLINVVEEMAIASGISVPPVYVLEWDDAINALVAGYSPHEAVIIVTKGAVQKLSRDELQGVMGHEFSHILNGDMALNLRLVGVLAGLTWMADYAERLIYEAAWHNKDLPREERGAGAPSAVFAALIAFIGFPGTFAADAIKAAVSRERELLADSASVQFTRNPDGIAGALDSILALRAHTAVRAVQCEPFSHMFFAPAVGRWWGFPSHPPILERIRRAHPRFQRDEYRARRHGIRNEVAVLDGAGNVVKHARMGEHVGSKEHALAMVASVGRPAVEHVDYAARLLARLPSRLREALHQADEAELAMFALALEPDEATREAELQALAARRGAEARAKVVDLQVYVGVLARNHMLTLADLAVPAIKEQRQKARDGFLADLTAMVESDRRVTLREFVLLTLLRQRLREGAGQPIRTQFRRIEELAPDAHVVLSLVSLDQAAFEKGAAVLKLGWRSPLEREKLDTAKVSQALERLRHLAPFAKPGILKACFEAVAADGVVRLAEAELVRMVAATLDCPVPPALAARDPQALAA
ncbi:MAG TPA: M48 family metalloprotease [Burkholderiales bacterium]|nr:M48 family metalloprotease [Burkholderiales bacterium]